MRTLEATKVGGFSRPAGVPMFSVRPPILAGSETDLTAISPLVASFEKHRPDLGIDAPRGMGPAATIRAVAGGLIAVGLVSRPLRDSEKDWGLTVLPYARTAVIWGAHPSVEEEGISAEELIQMYQGAKTRWRDGREIVLFAREPQNGSTETLERGIPGFKEAYQNGHGPKRWTTLYSDREMDRLLTATQGALGVTDLGSIKAHRFPVKVLKFDGVFPSVANIAGGRYALLRTLRFVFRRNTLPVDAMTFVQFARSKEAQKVLRANGYLPEE